jgi:eukaryotic-like serine/threonine-protein kinase
MECPQCQTPNAATAVRCEHCATPLGLDAATLVGAAEADADLNRTVDNWSAPVTFPYPSVAGGDAGELQPGSLLANRYEILSQLGVGGMGTVYKARDQEVDRLVAVKVIRAELAGNADILTRFKQELVLARKVTHKNVIRIFDLGRVSGLRYITMEYIDGQDLRGYVKKKEKLSREECVEIMQQVCLALEAAHNEKVVHRDLKPQNIMIDAQGKVFVMDFGIARSVGSEGLTMTGGYVGTPGYMSPEQVKGEEVDGRSDIFTMGIILYELLTNTMPYSAETVQRSMYKRTVERPSSVSSVDPTVPQYLSEVVAKCLEIDTLKRYQTAQELWADLEKWRSGGADPTGLLVRRYVRRAFSTPTIPIAAAAILLIVVGVFFARRWPTTIAAKKSEAVVPARALAVFPFRNGSGDAKLDWLGASLGEMLTNDIGQSASLRTISEERVSQVLHDLRIAPDARIEPATIDQLTQFTNADVVVWGEFAKFGDEVRIDATIADRKNSTQNSLSVKAANENEVLKAVDTLAGQIRQHLALSSSAIGELETTAFKPSSNSLGALRDFARGEQLQHVGKNLDALEAFKSAINEDANFALAYSKLSETYAQAHQDDQAQAASLKAVELSANLPKQEKYLIAATHAEILKEYPKAIESYEALAKASPGNTDVLFHLATLYETSGNLELAVSTLAKVRALDPKNAAVLLAQGRVELESNNAQKGLEDLNAALSLAIQLGNDEQKADILQAIGGGYAILQRPEDALRNYQESLDIKKRLGVTGVGIAVSLHGIANAQMALGKPDLALKNFLESLKIRREIGDKGGIGDVLNDLGGFYEDHGQAEQALKLYKESLQIQIDLGNEQARGLLLNNIGNIYLGEGNYQDAQTYYEQALQIRVKFNVPTDIADTRHNLGETAADLGIYEQALEQYHEALDLRRKVGDKHGIALETSGLGTVFANQGRYGAALSAKEEAMKIFRELGERSLDTVTIEEGYGQALAQVGKTAEAKAAFDDALALAREQKSRDEVARIQGLQGDNAYYSGDLKAARQAYSDALTSAAKSADVRLVLTTKFNAAKMDVAEGHAQAALPKLSSLASDANKAGFKYLSLQCSLYAAKALIQTKSFAKAADLLQNLLVHTEKLGLLALKAQGYALMAQAQQGQGKTSEAERANSTANQLFAEIKSESHFDVQTRPDIVGLLNKGT